MIRLLVLALGAVLVTACSSGSDATGPTQPPPIGERCLVLLHGKGDRGETTSVDSDGVVKIMPNGNQKDGSGRKWIYFPDAEYTAAVAGLRTAIDASQCKQIILGGFSNGAAFVAKIACQGETFADRVVGYVVDDPVPDSATDGCARDAAIPLSLVWTGGLADTAKPGWQCSDGGWICEGGTTIGIDAYAAALGVAVTPSALTKHEFWSENPALAAWP